MSSFQIKRREENEEWLLTSMVLCFLLGDNILESGSGGVHNRCLYYKPMSWKPQRWIVWYELYQFKTWLYWTINCQDNFKYMKNINHILSGGLSHVATPSSKGKRRASGACDPPTALSLWRMGVMGFCKQLAVSITVAKLKLEPRSWCPGPISFYPTICFSKETDFISVIKQAAENRLFWN